MSYCHSAPSVRPSSSVVVVRKLSHVRLLLWNCWTEFNETWQEAGSQHPLPSLCFSSRSEKQDGRPGLWLAETFSTSPLIITERNSTKFDRKQDLKALYQVCVFQADRKNKMAALASDWLRHFRLLLYNRWTEFNKTWQEARSQSPLTSLCFSGGSEKQDGRPGLWLAKTFSTSSLKPLNPIQRNLIGSKISKPLTKFVFFGPIGKTRWRPSLWLAETFSTSPLKPQNGIQQNLKGSKISKPSNKFVFFGRIGKTRWPPWPLIVKDIFDFFSETAEPNSTKLVRKQDLKALYQVCVFRADRKKQDGRLASDWLRYFRLLCRNRWTEFNETWQEARSQRPLPSLCFSGRSENQDGGLASDWLRHFRLLLWNRWMEFNETCQEARSQRPLPSLWFFFLANRKNKIAALASH